MNVMVTGGAGYIGSHAVKQLVEAGHRVVAVDNLHRGHARAVDRRADVRAARPVRDRRTGRRTPPPPGRLRDALRCPGLRRRVGHRSAGLLRQQHGGGHQPVEGDEGRGRPADGLQFHLRHLRRAGGHAHRRDHAAVAHQPLRLVEILRRAGAARLRGGRADVLLCGLALFQRGRLGGRRHAGRRPRRRSRT